MTERDDSVSGLEIQTFSQLLNYAYMHKKNILLNQVPTSWHFLSTAHISYCTVN